MTRWLVTGASGQLGSRLREQLGESDAVFFDRNGLDITDERSVREAITTHRPAVVINAAAYTAVDLAETHESDADLVNHQGAQHLATAIAELGGHLIHVSTDYVFDGLATRPYDENDAVAPQTAYGRTKLAGEQAVLRSLPQRALIVRTAWVYGGPGPNFVDTMVRLEKEKDTIDVVSDQIGSPTYVVDLAEALISLGTQPTPPSGVFHFVNSGQASWYELACAVFELRGADPKRVRPVGSDAFPRPAKRPGWSVLSTKKWCDHGLPPPRDWRSALTAALASASDR